MDDKDIIEINCVNVIDSDSATANLYVYRILDYSQTETDVIIEFEVYPEEKPEYEDGHMVYPGCPASAEIIKIKDAATGELEYNLNEIGNLDFVEEDLIS